MKRFLFFNLLILFFSFFSNAQQNKIDSLLNKLSKEESGEKKIILLGDICWEYLLISDFEKALNYGNKELALSQELKNDKFIAQSYSDIGSVYYSTGDYQHAITNHTNSLEIRERLNDSLGKGKNFNNLGAAYQRIGDNSKALYYWLKAMKVFENTNNKFAIHAILNNIGEVYGFMNDHQKALEFYEKSLKIKEELGDKYQIAGTLCNIGMTYNYQGKVQEALSIYNKALSLQKEIGDKGGMASSLSSIGTLYNKSGEIKKSLQFHNTSLEISRSIGDRHATALTLNSIGNVYLDLINYQLAIDNYQKALAIAKETGSKQTMMNSYNGLAHGYYGWKNFMNAYTYNQKYSQVKDSLFNEESSKQITEMQTKYETDKKEKEIQLLNKDKEIQSKDLERQKTIRNAVAGGLLLVLLFSFVLINRLLLIRKQKKIIEIEREKSEKLLLNILPKDTAEELKLTGKALPRFYEMVTVMFTDFKGFTTIAEKMSAEELVSELDFIFKKFDEIISKYPIEKIKTIGDAYMCAGGLPVANTANPMDVVMAGLEIQEWMKSQNKWQLRLGIHTGSVIAGVVGDKKFAYDIWGDAVNTASRMESSGEAGKVNISGETYKHLVGATDSVALTKSPLRFSFRGKIPAKNKGKIEMYFVEKAI